MNTTGPVLPTPKDKTIIWEILKVTEARGRRGRRAFLIFNYLYISTHTDIQASGSQLKYSKLKNASPALTMLFK